MNRPHYTINIITNAININLKNNDNPNYSDDYIKKLLETKFTPKKIHNMQLSEAYKASTEIMENAINKSLRLALCAKWLEFAIPPKSAEKERPKITNTSSCHVRLCPICQWRRSVNVYRNLAVIYNSPQLSDYKHLFATLTVRNVAPEELGNAIKTISAAYTKMMRRKDMQIVAGYTRTIEITRNPQNNTYHPHIHAILTVPKSYGSKSYISQRRLCAAWQEQLKLDYTPICDIRAIKRLDGKSVAEVAKYSVKPSDYIGNGNIEEIKNIITTLDPATDGKRFVSHGGIIRQLKREIFSTKNIEDVETAEIPQDWENWERILYQWHYEDNVYNKVHYD